MSETSRGKVRHEANLRLEPKVAHALVREATTFSVFPARFVTRIVALILFPLFDLYLQSSLASPHNRA